MGHTRATRRATRGPPTCALSASVVGCAPHTTSHMTMTRQPTATAYRYSHSLQLQPTATANSMQPTATAYSYSYSLQLRPTATAGLPTPRPGPCRGLGLHAAVQPATACSPPPDPSSASAPSSFTPREAVQAAARLEATACYSLFPPLAPSSYTAREAARAAAHSGKLQPATV